MVGAESESQADLIACRTALSGRGSRRAKLKFTISCRRRRLFLLAVHSHLPSPPSPPRTATSSASLRTSVVSRCAAPVVAPAPSPADRGAAPLSGSDSCQPIPTAVSISYASSVGFLALLWSFRTVRGLFRLVHALVQAQTPQPPRSYPFCTCGSVLSGRCASNGQVLQESRPVACTLSTSQDITTSFTTVRFRF